MIDISTHTLSIYSLSALYMYHRTICSSLSALLYSAKTDTYIACQPPLPWKRNWSYQFRPTFLPLRKSLASKSGVRYSITAEITLAKTRVPLVPQNVGKVSHQAYREAWKEKSGRISDQLVRSKQKGKENVKTHTFHKNSIISKIQVPTVARDPGRVGLLVSIPARDGR
jgi:hypothetical protein